jgi:hypothetical protein
MIYSEFQMEEDLADIIEDTFDTCSSNREEIYWLISFLRGIIGIKNKDKRTLPDNYKLNMWQYQMYLILDKYKHKWNM